MMSDTKKGRKPTWHKRYTGCAIRATIKTTESILEFTLPLTEAQVKQIVGIIFPKKLPIDERLSLLLPKETS